MPRVGHVGPTYRAARRTRRPEHPRRRSGPRPRRTKVGRGHAPDARPHPNAAHRARWPDLPSRTSDTSARPPRRRSGPRPRRTTSRICRASGTSARPTEPHVGHAGPSTPAVGRGHAPDARRHANAAHRPDPHRSQAVGRGHVPDARHHAKAAHRPTPPSIPSRRSGPRPRRTTSRKGRASGTSARPTRCGSNPTRARRS
jgi:hypothetical protein